MKNRRSTLIAAGIALTGWAFQAWGLPWDKDMRNQPSVKPQEARVEHSAGSVPVSGTETIPPPKDIAELVQVRLRAGEELINPTRDNPESLNRGKQVYEVHCQLCHGSEGRGDGLVGLKFVPAPMDLTLDYVQLQPDGQIYFTISHGSIAMPYYRDTIAEDDRWHVVNYVKNVLGNK